MDQALAICEARERQLAAAGLVRAPNGEWVKPAERARQMSPDCNTRMEIELAYDLGRREGQVEWLRAQLRASLAQLTGRHPGGQRLAISGASAILRQALAVSEPWEAPTK